MESLYPMLLWMLLIFSRDTFNSFLDVYNWVSVAFNTFSACIWWFCKVGICCHPMPFLDVSIIFLRFAPSIQSSAEYSLLLWLITKIYLVFPNNPFQLTSFNSIFQSSHIHNLHRVFVSYHFPNKKWIHCIMYHFTSHRRQKI